jgi:hypothetical protein
MKNYSLGIKSVGGTTVHGYNIALRRQCDEWHEATLLSYTEQLRVVTIFMFIKLTSVQNNTSE